MLENVSACEKKGRENMRGWFLLSKGVIYIILYSAVSVLGASEQQNCREGVEWGRGGVCHQSSLICASVEKS